MADIFTKPTWLTPEQARNTVATSMGWCLLHTRNNKYEVLVSIKDLDKKLAEKEAGESIADHVSTKKTDVVARTIGELPETAKAYVGAKRGPKSKAEKDAIILAEKQAEETAAAEKKAKQEAKRAEKEAKIAPKVILEVAVADKPTETQDAESVQETPELKDMV